MLQSRISLFLKLQEGFLSTWLTYFRTISKFKKSNPQRFLEGKLVVSESKKRVIEIADTVTWIEAFTIFSMILCHTFPLAGKI